MPSALLLSWRCPWHPLAGGAERYSWELATRLVRAGRRVTFLTARPPGLPAQETRDGVAIRRRGGAFTVYLWAALFLLLRRRRFGVVIDCQNGVPFLSPLILTGSRTAVVCLVHHVHQDQFRLRFGRALSWVGRWLEGPVSRVVYRRHPVVAVSPSTRWALRRRLGFRSPIYVIPNGHDVNTPRQPRRREVRPTLIYLGRLVRHKRVELLLHAAAGLLQAWPDLQVEIVGVGPALPELRSLSVSLGLEEVVRFRGRVSNDERQRLLSAAWLLVTPSLGEGWGLTVIEANAAGRPVVGFRVPGLVDSILEGWNGWMVDETEGLERSIHDALRTLSRPDRVASIQERCQRWADRFSWDRTFQRWASLLEQQGAGPGPGGRSRQPTAWTDTGTVVMLEGTEDERLVASAAPALIWEVVGRQLHILFQGLDGEDAIANLEQLGVAGAATVRVARTLDLLCGPAVGALAR